MEAIKIDLNFEALRGKYFQKLQQQLDVISLLIGGARAVTLDQVNEAKGFQNFSPSANTVFDHETARRKALEWLQGALVRDCIEATGLFLDECLTTCAVLELSKKGVANIIELKHVFEKLPIQHHKIHFPEKIATLNRKHGIAPAHTEFVISLNKLRACLVHRLGEVSHLDANENGILVGRWLSSKLVLRGLETGTELVLTGPGGGLDEESHLEMHIIEHTRSFKIGEVIDLSDYEMFSTIFTLWQFGVSCVEKLEAYAKELGLTVNQPVAQNF